MPQETVEAIRHPTVMCVAWADYMPHHPASSPISQMRRLRRRAVRGLLRASVVELQSLQLAAALSLGSPGALGPGSVSCKEGRGIGSMWPPPGGDPEDVLAAVGADEAAPGLRWGEGDPAVPLPAKGR